MGNPPGGGLLLVVRCAAALLFCLELFALLAAAAGDFWIIAPNPPWVGHRWHPIVVTGTVSLAVTATTMLLWRRLGVATRIALLLVATVTLSVGSIEWHARVFGTRTYFVSAFASLDLGQDTKPVRFTYLAGPGDFDTPDDPSATQTWLVSGPLRQSCPRLAAAAGHWHGVTFEDYDAKPSGPLDCHFAVTYQFFEVSFQHVSGPERGPWMLEAFVTVAG